MAEDVALLAQATEEAEELLRLYRNSATIQTTRDAHRTVYILEGCDCPEQGAYHRYHVHAFTPQQFEGWWALHYGRVVASYLI